MLKENAIIGRRWSSAKLFIMQNYTDNTNGDVPLVVENVWYFYFPFLMLHTCSFGKWNKTDQSFSLWKILLFYDDNVNQLR